MLIKLNNDIHVNPELIAMLAPRNTGEDWIVLFGSGQAQSITAAAADYLLTMIETDNAFLDTIEAPPTRSLQSRIATFLQNNTSVTPEGLELAFAQDGADFVKAALNELMAQGVTRFGPNNTILHASHATPAVEW